MFKKRCLSLFERIVVYIQYVVELLISFRVVHLAAMDVENIRMLRRYGFLSYGMNPQTTNVSCWCELRICGVVRNL